MLAVDAEARTADVQGMTTYEDLVDATLPHGLMPLVVPQLKTITLGGAVAGLGIESVVVPQRAAARVGAARWRSSPATAGSSSPGRDNEHADLFRGFPNSYGTLGYALRLTIELEPVRPYVRLRHLRFGTRTTASPRWRRSAPTASTTASGSTSSTARCSARRACTSRSARFVDEAPTRQRLHRDGHLLPVDPASARPTT